MGEDFPPDVPEGMGGGFDFPNNATISGYPLQLAASYEIDLWGRVRHANKAALQEYEATKEQIEIQASTIAGEISDAWFQLLELRERKKLLQRHLELAQKTLGVIEARYQSGLISSSAVHRQRAQVAAQESAFPSVDAQLQFQEHRIALLQGHTPTDPLYPTVEALPQLPPMPSMGVPSDLLQKRPDVEMAFHRVLAADHRVGVAIAERYPRLSLTASTGFMGRPGGEFFGNWIYSLGANLVAPLFEGGRLKAEQVRAQAALEEVVWAYGQTLLRAVIEVENALVEIDLQNKLHHALEQERESLRAAHERAQADYLAGLTGYLSVLESVQAFNQIELRELSVRHQALSARLKLHRALGSAWTEELAK